MSTRPAFIVDYVRTPIGRYGGRLAPVRPDDLAAIPLRALMDRNSAVDWETVDDVLLGAGFQLGQIFTPYNENMIAQVEASEVLAGDAARAFGVGLALGWRLRFVEARYTAPAAGSAKIEAWLQGEVLAGFRAGLALAPTSFDAGS